MRTFSQGIELRISIESRHTHRTNKRIGGREGSFLVSSIIKHETGTSVRDDSNRRRFDRRAEPLSHGNTQVKCPDEMRRKKASRRPHHPHSSDLFERSTGLGQKAGWEKRRRIYQRAHTEGPTKTFFTQNTLILEGPVTEV